MKNAGLERDSGGPVGSPFVVRLTVAYTAALTLLAILAWLEHAILQTNIRRQSKDTLIVSTTERQRMLVQRVALCSLGLVSARDTQVRNRFREELSSLSSQIETSHRALLEGSEEISLPKKMSEEVRGMYLSPPLSLDSGISGFVQNVRDLIRIPEEELTFQHPRLDNIVTQSTQLLTSYETVVAQLRKESEAGIARLQQLETLLLIVTITMLAATAGFIFRPLVLRVNRELRQREEAEAEAKRIAEELEHYARELERSNKELEQFAAIASHDLQEPLRSVASFTELLRKGLKDRLDDQTTAYMDAIGAGARRMKTLIDDLLNLSRITTSHAPFERVDLNDVIGQVLADLGTRIKERDATIECSDLPSIDADPSQMRQLFQNLVGNALKFCREGAKPVVKIASHQGSAKRRGHSLCEIVVEDNGIGFSKEHREAIFEIFHRLHGREKYEGTGIGLAVCKRIVDRHGGNISAEGEQGKGARFTILLPVHQKRQGTRSAA